MTISALTRGWPLSKHRGIHHPLLRSCSEAHGMLRKNSLVPSSDSGDWGTAWGRGHHEARCCKVHCCVRSSAWGRLRATSPLSALTALAVTDARSTDLPACFISPVLAQIPHTLFISVLQLLLKASLYTYHLKPFLEQVRRK